MVADAIPREREVEIVISVSDATDHDRLPDEEVLRLRRKIRDGEYDTRASIDKLARILKLMGDC